MSTEIERYIQSLDFMQILFERHEATCFSETPYGTVIGVEYNPKTDIFFSINPMNPAMTRCDAAVTVYRNILIEMDKIPRDTQEALVESIGLPYTTSVYSGKKSVHYIISLETPCKDEATYRALVKRVYKAVGNDIVDQSNKNPSRFSRLAGALRPDTGKTQDLLRCGSRVPNALLEEWLEKRGAPYDDIWETITTEKRSTYKNPSRLRGTTKNFLMFGAPQGEWNRGIFQAASDLCRCGYDEEDAIEELRKVTGSLDVFDRKTIASAFKNELRKP